MPGKLRKEFPLYELLGVFFPLLSEQAVHKEYFFRGGNTTSLLDESMIHVIQP